MAWGGLPATRPEQSVLRKSSQWLGQPALRGSATTMKPASGRGKPFGPHRRWALGYRKALHRASLGEEFHKPRPGLGVRGGASEWPGPWSPGHTTAGFPWPLW